MDCDDTFCMNVDLVEKNKQKNQSNCASAFYWIHDQYAKIIKNFKKYKIPIVEDACQSILASINKKMQDLGEILVHFLCIH